ncbi:MAG: S9 family peptidase [Alphaproteobacteria bacterium]
MRLLPVLLCLPALVLVGAKSVPQPGDSLLDPQVAKPPVAAQVPSEMTVHGERLVDPYAWLRDENDPQVLDYLKAENEYTAAVLAPVAALRDALYDEMLGRLVADDSDILVREGDIWYQWRIGADDEYWTLYRWLGSEDAPPQVLLDINAMSQGYDYFDVIAWDASRDGRYLAYSTDTTGGLEYTLHVVDLDSGEEIGTPVDAVDNFTWSPDNRALYYVATDAAARAYQVHYRTVDAWDEDRVVFTEDDPEFGVDVMPAADRRFVVIHTGSSDTDESLFADPYDPDSPPVVVLARRPGTEYGATHAGGEVIVRINDAGPNFRVASMSMDAMRAGASSDDLRTLVAERPDVVIEGGTVSARHIVLQNRRDAQTYFEVYDRATGRLGAVSFPEPAYSAGGEWNPEYDTDLFVYSYESQVTPWSVYALNLNDGTSTLLQRDPVPGGFDPAAYETRRIFATATDGTRIPISIAFARSTPLDGTAPLLLEAYGAYASTYDPYFDRSMISLLDRGVVYAYAHVRGGSEYGEAWYDGGRLANKMNTFTDTIAVAEHLVAEGYSTPGRMALMGASAGGLTVGAVINMRPDLFAAAVLMVPFVDVLTAMLDPSLPLTTTDYPEWGNPEKADAYGWMRAYDPYRNLAVRDYPDMLVIGGLNDDQVPYWQPAKYVARMRTLADPDAVVLLDTDLESGHMGGSGRSGGLERWSLTFAFLLASFGIAE